MSDTQHRSAASDHDSPSAHPSAEVHSRRGWAWQPPLSRWWWLTAAAAFFVIVLLYYYNRTTGPLIWVRFQEGHGVQPGDRLRYRGIEAGEVVSVELTNELNAVSIGIRLHEAAAELAREGSRFWIERPKIGFSGVRGLDTIVGGRYLAVLPGAEEAAPRRAFVGLENAPIEVDRVAGGLEIVLDAPHRYGVDAGAPLTHRGVQVGAILDVQLAADAASVELRAYVYPEYRSLVRENTSFWSTSGLNIDLGVTGVNVSMDTLATIAAGGVALATPDNAGRSVSTGHRFQLRPRPRNENEMHKWQPRLAVGAAQLPEGAALPTPLRGLFKWSKRTLGIRRQQQVEGWVLALDDGRIMAPLNLLTPPADAREQEGVLELVGAQFPLAANAVTVTGKLGVAAIDLSGAAEHNLWPAASLRAPTGPEDALLMWGTRERSTPIPAARMEASENGWTIDLELPIDTDAHGSAVMATGDGAVIGMFVVDGDERMIVPVTSDLVP